MENNNRYETEVSLFEFVESIFEEQGIRLSNGDFSIETAYDKPKFFVIHLVKEQNEVVVYINKTLIGYFRQYTEQGYQYEFQQSYRVNIRKGRTKEEQFMEDICIFFNDKVLLRKAYH